MFMLLSYKCIFFMTIINTQGLKIQSEDVKVALGFFLFDAKHHRRVKGIKCIKTLFQRIKYIHAQPSFNIFKILILIMPNEITRLILICSFSLLTVFYFNAFDLFFFMNRSIAPLGPLCVKAVGVCSQASCPME